MSAKDYILTHPVFSTADIQRLSPSKETAETLLRRAVASGKIERIRRGLYASQAGVFKGSTPDPYDIIIAADPESIVSYRSALSAHGVAHNVSFDFTFRSNIIKSGFEYKGIRYTPYSAEPGVDSQRMRTGIDSFFNVTTREQTFVDCLTYPVRSGGSEEVIRSLSSITYLDFRLLEKMLMSSTDSVRAKAGWLIEENKGKWDAPESLLERLARSLKGNVVRLGSKKDPTLAWSARWNLSIPFTEKEIDEWTH